MASSGKRTRSAPAARASARRRRIRSRLPSRSPTTVSICASASLTGLQLSVENYSRSIGESFERTGDVFLVVVEVKREPHGPGTTRSADAGPAERPEGGVRIRDFDTNDWGLRLGKARLRTEAAREHEVVLSDPLRPERCDQLEAGPATGRRQPGKGGVEPAGGGGQFPPPLG